jgi:fluoride ion exporter CrcB/FEX
MQDAEILKAMLNTVAQVVLGFGAAFVGFILARFL